MDEQSRAEYEARCQDLRAELKRWEGLWAQENGGKKPGRDDIKRNPDLAQKYKNYQRCRDILDGKVPVPSKEQTKPRKRKSDHAVAPSETPMKRSRHVETPSKGHFHDTQVEETPTISRKLFSPTAVTVVGPTPQRDGRVLGLFDLLEESDAGGTPTKGQDNNTDGVPNQGVQATPSKRSVSDAETTPRMGRTPMSASKRQYLNTFMSPLKSRDANAGSRTPSKLHFDTPQFLRRYNLTTVDENGEFDAPAPLRLPRKPLGRGLSEIVAGLRKIEEDKADADLEALREMEAEAEGMMDPTRSPSKAVARRREEEAEILAKDSQSQRLPLGGFDDEGMYDSPVEEEPKGADGNPLGAFKKKGQKRTTRRVKMKPTWTKRPDAKDTRTTYSDGEEEEEEEDDATHPDAASGGDDSDFSDDGSRKKEKTKRSKSKGKADDGKAGPVKKAARKVNELAHANFHRLKLRQNGAKGGPGYNSKFRRRR